MLNYKLMPISLIMFDGDGGADGNGNGQSVSDSAVPAKKGGEFENVVFGRQPEATAGADDNATEPQITPEQRQADFDTFIEQNKDLYDARFSKEFDDKFNRRFRGHKQLESKFNKADEVMSILAQRYGVNGIDEIREAVENDDRLLADKAEAEGLTVEQLKEVQSLRARAEAEKRRADMLYGQRQADMQHRQWVIEANGLKDTYPEFDLQSELENPRFESLLKAGVPMDHAYMVIHMNDILSKNAQEVAQQSSKATADNIRARGNRPKENAGSATPGVIYKSDVSTLTAKERKEIARRAARGEFISF